MAAPTDKGGLTGMSTDQDRYMDDLRFDIVRYRLAIAPRSNRGNGASTLELARHLEHACTNLEGYASTLELARHLEHACTNLEGLIEWVERRQRATHSRRHHQG